MLKHLGYLLLAFVVAFTGATIVSYAQEQPQRPPIDRSKGYFGGATPRFIEPPQGRQRDIIDLSSDINVNGILGCAGLEINAMMRDVLGVDVDVSDLADQMMQNLQSQFAQEMLTQVMADPTIASIQQQVSALAHARLTMIKKECNAIQARREGATAEILAEAQQRCMNENGPNDERCRDGDLLRASVEDTLQSDRWNKSFQQQICDRDTENCEWLRVLPDFKPNLGGDPNDNSDSSGDSGSDDASGGEPPAGGEPSGGGEGRAEKKEVQPPAISLFELRDGAREDMLDEISMRVASAASAVQKYGYTDALRYANTGRAPDAEEGEQQATPAPPANGEESADDRGTAVPFSLLDVVQSNSCTNFTLEAPDAFSTNPDATPQTAAPLTAPGVGEVQPAPPPANDGNWVWPTDHRKITSRYGPRNISNGGSRNHSGTDIRAYQGNPIYAMTSGKITKADPSPTSGTGSSCGNTIMLVSGPWRLGHCHLSAYRVKAGDIVQAGQVIGLSGGTSNGRIRNMAPHLHLTVRHNGVRKDPEETVLKLATGTAPEPPENLDGPDEYGNESYAQAVTSSLSADDPFVKALHEDMRKLSLRVGQTADCMLNNELDPHVYVKLAMLPEVTRDSMIDNLSEVMAHQAIIATFNAVIQQLAVSLARKTGDGEGAMNPSTQKFAAQQIELLKNMRDALQIDFDMKKEVAARVMEMNDYIDERQELMRRRMGR